MKKNVAFYYDCLIITAEIEILLKKKNKLTGHEPTAYTLL